MTKKKPEQPEPKAKGVLYLVLFHVEDSAAKPIGGATVRAESPNGEWTSTTNPCGDVINPAKDQPTDPDLAGVMLAEGDYTVTVSKSGYTTRELPVHIETEGPPIRIGLQGGSSGGVVPIPPTVPGGPLPPTPTRQQVCSVQHSLAGLWYDTAQFGRVPAWFYGRLNTEDRAQARAAHRKAGDTHIPFPLTEAYREGGTLWPAELADGYDYTSDEALPTYRALAVEIIHDGFLIDCAMGGDGLGIGPDYNDPVGRTYGHGWLMSNMARMIRALVGDGTKRATAGDLTDYICFRPGWDAIFYGWGGVEATPQSANASQMKSQRGLRWRYVKALLGEPEATPMTAQTTQELDDQQQRMKNFGEKFRSILPLGHLSVEHTPGNIPVGLGPADWAPGGIMSTYDALLSEYATVHEDSYWQVVGRCIDPYHRPPDQPANDDPHPPKYLPGQQTPRGPYFYVAFEPTQNGVYEFCRGRCSQESMMQQDTYMRSTGVTLTGYPVHWT